MSTTPAASVLAVPVEPLVAPGFEKVAARFESLFDQPGAGGGALAVRWHGVPVVDTWAGTRDRATRRPWLAETGAPSFSTSKGVTAAVLHRYLDRHELQLDRPVAAWWPAFGANGKAGITLRDVLTHQAGLHDVRDLIDSAQDLLEDEEMEARLAAATPDPLPGNGPGYHAMTFGWLLSGLMRAVTGRGMRDLWQQELAEPLGLTGLRIGIPDGERAHVAELLETGWDFGELLHRLPGLTPWARRASEAMGVRGINELFMDPARRVLGAQMPAVNGVFTARDLAALYTGLGGHEVNGVRLLSEASSDRLRIVQEKGRDYVMGIPMYWRLGYHRAFMAGRRPRQAFGHYGFGGSGAWVDPVGDLSVAFVTNRLGTATTPLGDVRFFRLSTTIVGATRSAPIPMRRFGHARGEVDRAGP